MDPHEIRAHVERMLGSRVFTASARMSRFLRFAVEEALAGRGGELKESLIGIEVFDRTPDYDPRIDPIVRVEARRLRSKIDAYYRGDGAREPLRVEFPRGGYAPLFRMAAEPPSPAAGAVPTPPAAAPRTIAVLPFANLSPEPDSDYFGDGLARELIHALTRLPELRVMAWNSAVRLRDSGEAVSRLGQRMHVDAVLEGSVRRSGGRVRITAQLVDAASGVYLWSQSYDRALDDLLSLQEELALSIARALRVRLANAEVLSALRSAGSVTAYSLYLQGRHAWNRRTEEGLRQSIVYFERALAESSACALAWAGLADAYAILADFGLEPAEEFIPKGRHAALRALEMDPALAEAHTSLGLITSLHDWRWEQGERHYRKALDLNPGYATAHHWIGCDLFALEGRFDDALRHMGIARSLDPLEPNLFDSENYVHMLARRFDEAERRYHLLIAEHPGYPKAYTGLGRVYFLLGRWDDSVEMLERGRAIIGDTPSLIGALAHVHGAAGRRSEARRHLNHLQSLWGHRHVPSTSLAVAHLGLGDRSVALDCLEAAAARRELSLGPLHVHPIYDVLRGEPRFEALINRMGIRRN